jgi:quinol monooxygenase YgiN
MNFGSAVLVAAAITAVIAAPAGAQAPAQASYAVTYLEVTPAAKAEAIDLIKQVAAASRKEPGNLRYEVLQRVDRSNQFAILESWSDLKALEAHDGGTGMTEFRAKLKPMRSGPYDMRPSISVTPAPVAAAAAKGSTYVLTHVDVTPNVKDTTIDMLWKLAEDGRKEPGSERLEAWQQNNRANHFTVVEVWTNREAADGHAVTASTKEFREKLGPMIGALYDDRFYTSIE